MSLWVGAMSGTSLDGIDVALVEIEGANERPDRWRVVGFETAAYTDELRAKIRGVIDAGSAEAICALDFELGDVMGRAIRRALDGADVSPDRVEAIGSHGQTIWHVPPAEGVGGSTLQIGQAAVIAEATSCGVVSDFRVRDMAVGGEGAPLTAYTDWLLLQGDEPRAIQNIGGIANVTALPGATSDARPQAYDTGPGVALLDAAVERLTGGRMRYDEDGRLAKAGRVSESALEDWLDDPFFEAPPPKSTGRERFSESRLGAWLDAHADLSAEDAAATLTELTARTIASGYRWLEDTPAATYLCGGGARNSALRDRLTELLDPMAVRDVSELGVDGDAREAVAFGVLARQHVLGFEANATWATGARAGCVLGVWTPP